MVSRRAAETLISQGRVEVNGHVVSALGSKAESTADVIKVDGRRLKFDSPRRYLLMSRPRGVMSTRLDPQRRPTVVDLVSRAGIKGYFYPVGRLDYDSEGLIILTNDGDFAERVAHPRYEVAPDVRGPRRGHSGRPRPRFGCAGASSSPAAGRSRLRCA